MILRGLSVAYPSLNIAAILTPQGAKLYPQTLTKCLDQLDQPNSLGGLPLNQLIDPNADLTPEIKDLALNDPDNLKINGPVLMSRGWRTPPSSPRSISSSRRSWPRTAPGSPTTRIRAWTTAGC